MPRLEALGLLGLLAVLTACSSSSEVRVDLTAKVGCGPADGLTIEAEVSADPPTDLIVEVVGAGQVLASKQVEAGVGPEELPPLIPAFHGDASPRKILADAVARARDAATGGLLAETPIEPLDRPCP